MHHRRESIVGGLQPSTRALDAKAAGFAAQACCIAAAVVLGASVLSVLLWAVLTLSVRLTIPGETEVLFEASRIRAGLPLYVDPVVGAFDYGAVPARYFVVYPPLWSWGVSHVPAGRAALFFARA